MVNLEIGKTLGQVCEIDPEEVIFQNTINSWVNGEATYRDVLHKYPSHLLDIPERIIRRIFGVSSIK